MMKKRNFIFLAAGFLVIGLSIAGGIVVRQVTNPSLARVVVGNGGMALVTVSAPAVQRQTLDLWPLLLTLRHLKVFSGFGWENFYAQITKITALPLSAQPAALKKFVPKRKTNTTIAPTYRPSITALLAAIASRIQKGNLNIIIGIKGARVVPPTASLAEFLKLGLLPKAVTLSLQKTIASLQKFSVEKQIQTLAAIALDLQKNKTISPPLRNIIWELHAITAFTLTGASQIALCTNLAGETAPATVAECNAQGGAVYDAQCSDITLFTTGKSTALRSSNLPELLPSAYASGGNLSEYEKANNKLTSCEKAVQYACVYSEIWKRPYTPGKYICGDFALDMKEWLWKMIKEKISIRGGKAPTEFVLDEERYEEALRKARSGEGQEVVNIDFLVEQPMEKPDPRVKITGASTDLAPSLTHFFNDAECVDENGKSQKIYFDALSCKIYDKKIAGTIFSEHVISEKNKNTGEAFMKATRKRKEEYATYWQKQRLEEIRNPKPTVGQNANEAATFCWNQSSETTGYPLKRSQTLSDRCPNAFIGYCQPGSDLTVYWNFIGVYDPASGRDRVVITCGVSGGMLSGECDEFERMVREESCPL